jgi:hypothetical protein
MAPAEMPHAGHEEHLCYLHNIGFVQTHFDEYKKLVSSGEFVCKNCGRVAASSKNLCAPVKLT